MRIDAHQHFWKFDPVRDSWITDEMSTIQRDFFPKDLEPLLNSNKIDGCIAVQANQSESETQFLLDLATKNQFIKGVVGWVDLRGNDIKDRLSYFSSFQLIKGFRHVVQAEPDGFLLDKKFREGIAALQDFNFTYDILVYPNQLKEAAEFIRHFPNQKFIIDHLAKPYIKAGKIDEWKKDLKQCSLFENVYCKLSGLVTEADWKNWKPQDLTPYLDTALELFGSCRLIYGSDWPVCLLAADYNQQLSVIENYISKLSSSEKTMIMGENAVRFYNL